jgi:dienelactone hydrolase
MHRSLATRWSINPSQPRLEEMNSRIAIALTLLLFFGLTCPARSAAGIEVSQKLIDRKDLSATVFVPQDRKIHPAVLVLGGSEGGRAWAVGVAKRLAENGYVAMAESYFGDTGLPTQLQNIPLERFQSGIDYLGRQSFVDKRFIAAMGISKGAEAVLILASVDDRITAVVAASPSDVIWQGIDRKGGLAKSSWTFHGNPLSYVPFKPCAECKGLLDLYRVSRDAGKADTASMIKVDQINGPILMFSSKADQIWPSTEMAESIANRLHRDRFKFSVEDIDYPHAGHTAFGTPTDEASAKEDTDFAGGNPADLVKARKASWQLMLDFLADAFSAEKNAEFR